MSDDFGSALHDIAARAGEEHARHPSGRLGTDRLVGAARRRRRTRTAVTSGVTVLAVAALALGADAAGIRWDAAPQPATTETSTPAPTPTPSATATPSDDAAAVTLPTGDPSLPFGVCGSVVGAAPPAPVTPTVTVETVLATSSVPPGGPLTVTTRQWVPGGMAASLTDARGPRLAVVRDGVVVAVTSPTLADRGTDPAGPAVGWRSPTDTVMELDPASWYVDGFARAVTGSITLTVCAPGDDGTAPPSAPGAPLPPGTYELHPLLEVRTAGDGESDVELPENADELAIEDLPQLAASPARTAVGPPVTVTVTTDAAPTPTVGTVAPALPASAGDLTCGSPAPTPTAPDASLRLASSPDVPDSVGDGALALETSLTWAGGGRLTGWASVGSQAFSVQDGVVVATPGLGLAPADLTGLPVDLGSGAPLDLSGRVRVVPCGSEVDRTTSRPDPGTYDVYVAAAVSVETAAGRAPGDAPVTVTLVAPPFTIQVAG